MLHRMALGSAAIAEMSHDVERGLYLKASPQARGGRHVYVTGLARSGSTILLRELHRTGVFGSLTYADMPFVLAPNLWARMARKTAPGEKAERAHGDGIEVDHHSPEALEEVFWRVFCGPDYIAADGLHPHEPLPEVIDGYLDLIRLILRRTGKTRYLAKNNNLILRLATLAQAMPEAIFLVPLRAPVQHAGSLLGQHRRFLSPDPFTVAYMTWLAHHEFGATHRPFLFGARPQGDPLALDYWLQVWIAAHTELARVAALATNVLIIPYDDLGTDPALWPAIAARIGVQAGPFAELRSVADRSVPDHSADLAAAAQSLHHDLRSKALTQLLRAP